MKTSRFSFELLQKSCFHNFAYIVLKDCILFVANVEYNLASAVFKHDKILVENSSQFWVVLSKKLLPLSLVNFIFNFKHPRLCLSRV